MRDTDRLTFGVGHWMAREMEVAETPLTRVGESKDGVLVHGVLKAIDFDFKEVLIRGGEVGRYDDGLVQIIRVVTFPPAAWDEKTQPLERVCPIRVKRYRRWSGEHGRHVHKEAECRIFVANFCEVVCQFCAT